MQLQRVTISWTNGDLSWFEVGTDNVLAITYAKEAIVVHNNDGSGSNLYLKDIAQIDWVKAREHS